jgi:predicted nuclease with TOPRIM domain
MQEEPQNLEERIKQLEKENKEVKDNMQKLTAKVSMLSKIAAPAGIKQNTEKKPVKPAVESPKRFKGAPVIQPTMEELNAIMKAHGTKDRKK